MMYIEMDMMRHIVIQTNLYAEQFLRDNNNRLGAYTRARRWKDTNVDEILKFLGLTLLMSIVKSQP